MVDARRAVDAVHAVAHDVTHVVQVALWRSLLIVLRRSLCLNAVVSAAKGIPRDGDVPRVARYVVLAHQDRLVALDVLVASLRKLGLRDTAVVRDPVLLLSRRQVARVARHHALGNANVRRLGVLGRRLCLRRLRPVVRRAEAVDAADRGVSTLVARAWPEATVARHDAASGGIEVVEDGLDRSALKRKAIAAVPVAEAVALVVLTLGPDVGIHATRLHSGRAATNRGTAVLVARAGNVARVAGDDAIRLLLVVGQFAERVLED